MLINDTELVKNQNTNENGWKTLVTREWCLEQGKIVDGVIKVQIHNDNGRNCKLRGIRVMGIDNSLLKDTVRVDEEHFQRDVSKMLELGIKDFVENFGYKSNLVGSSKDEFLENIIGNEESKISILREIFKDQMEKCGLKFEKLEVLLAMKNESRVSPSKCKVQAALLSHSRSSLVTAFKLLKMLVKIDDGKTFFYHPKGVMISRAMLHIIRRVNEIPSQLLKSIFKHMGQLFLFAGKYADSPCHSIICELGEEIVWLAKRSTHSRPADKRPAEIDVYRVLVEAAVMGSFALSIGWKSSFSSKSALNDTHMSTFSTQDSSSECLSVLSNFVDKLNQLSCLSAECRAIDDELLKFIEREHRDRIDSMKELETLTWSALVGTATTSTIVAYPKLISTVDRAEEEGAGLASVGPELTELEQGHMHTLLEMFPTYSFDILYSAYHKLSRDVEKVAAELIENPPSEEGDCSRKSGKPLATCSELSSRFEFIKSLNVSFCQVFDLINFQDIEEGKEDGVSSVAITTN